MTMLKLIALVIFEAIVGIAAAALLLAVIVPLSIRYHVFEPGDGRGAAVIGAVLVLTVGGMLLRPGSASRRRRN